MKIYTKHGDSGRTSLFNGSKCNKSDAACSAMGDVDELNGFIGLAMSFMDGSNPEIKDQLTQIQHQLFNLGAALATPSTSSSLHKIAITTYPFEKYTDGLESWIDKFDDTLPKLNTFILPSGGHVASTLHVARSVCRRAERCMIAYILTLSPGDIDPDVMKYINRLSDYLFVIARVCSSVGDVRHYNSSDT